MCYIMHVIYLIRQTVKNLQNYLVAVGSRVSFSQHNLTYSPVYNFLRLI